MDYPGLVAGMCKKLETIIGSGFAGQSLPMFPRFFTSTPLDKSIREGTEPEHMNDKVPGRVLDKILEPNVSKVYFEMAIKVAEHSGLLIYALT